ncbi:hypothetical protein GUITHDRAFT_117654 [Guillardia theta CCMP2712]|uniref:Uncharacterized protein n=1 Tax=Guillardia theta (strain CCMP2712) TaxID=905079 RepID=L1IIT3_GUITC|nr:hypothetical protein GUITHDRAFT_117654 [Guillardia theta CCMP2712]EKX36146.1 hypothetical protein GUITHDRAFT_117654 [Guillardia theta CCMP2712]|eukprot:XP_005823126.1 hypothetical protein GUITHDRAFT_117654 [Guillardia theta CCMP2712]
MLSAPTQRTTTLTDHQVDLDKIDDDIDYYKKRIKFLQQDIPNMELHMQFADEDSKKYIRVYINWARSEIERYNQKIKDLPVP